MSREGLEGMMLAWLIPRKLDMLSGVWLVFSGLLLAAAVTDARSYRIPNFISAALVILFFASASKGLGIEGLWPHLATSVIVLAVGYGLFQLTGMGAGDAKLGAAIALWVGPASLQSWLTFFALAMLALAVLLIGARRLASSTVAAEPSFRILRRGAPVPLGVALSCSAIIVSPGFDPSLWLF